MNNSTAELFVEVMMEKIPPNAQLEAEICLQKCIIEQISGYENMADSYVKTVISPHRVCFAITQVPFALRKKSQEIRGPEVGVSSEILEKFAAKYGKTTSNLYEKTFVKNNFWCLLQEHEPEQYYSALPKMIQDVLDNLIWREYMDWGVELKWIRPVRKIIAMFNGSPLMFHWHKAGIDSMPYSTLYLTSEEEFVFDSFQAYRRRLEDRNIFVDYQTRVKSVLNQIKHSLNHNESISKDSESMAKYIARFSESPTLYRIETVQDFKIPDEIKRAMIMHHEQCVPILEDNKLSTTFFKHSNYILEDGGNIFISDVRHSVEARLKNAEYFWHKDCELTKEHYVDGLSKTVFYQGLGTYQQQMVRLEFMAGHFFGNMPDLRLAAHFLNLDINMETVFEIPELHGIISALYGKEKYGLSDKVVSILSNGMELEEDLSKIPHESLLLAFIHNLDILVGFLGIGEVPRGSSDQLGLRRSALIIARIGFHIKQLPSFAGMVDHLINLYSQQSISLGNNTVEVVVDFVKDRIISLLKEKSEQFGKCFACADITWEEMDNLTLFEENKSDFGTLITFYVRLCGILESTIPQEGDMPKPKEYAGLTQALSAAYKSKLDELKALAKASNQLFESAVKIKDMDGNSREEVLNILAKIKTRFDQYCDFKGLSQVE